MTPHPASSLWRHAPRRLVIALPLALAIGPPALLARAMLRDTVDLPWKDQWTFAREVVHAHDGELTLGELWMQHNEHRVPVAKLVLHALALLSGWDVRWEVAANFVMALAMILLVALTIRRTVGAVAPLAVGGLVLAASAIQTSLVQWQNWTWGWQLGLLLAEAGAVVVAAALAYAPAAPAAWAVVAALAAVAGALSNGAGLALLVVAPLGLLALRTAGVRLSRGTVLACAALSVATAGAYGHGWRPAFGQPKPVAVAGNVGALLEYVLRFLGGPIVSWNPTRAWRWGLVGMTAVSLCAAFVWTRAPSRRRALVPWLALAAFSAGAAMLTAVGRLGAGRSTALLSRYATYAVPLWLAVGPLVAIAIATVSSRTTRVVLLVTALGVSGLAVSDARQSWVLGEQSMAGRALVARRAAACIAHPAMAADACYRAICWKASYAREGAIALQGRSLGPWRQSPH